MKTTNIIERKYIINLGELKEKLGIKGEIVNWELQFRGRSPDEIAQGKNQDIEEIEITTREEKDK